MFDLWVLTMISILVGYMAGVFISAILLIALEYDIIDWMFVDAFHPTMKHMSTFWGGDVNHDATYRDLINYSWWSWIYVAYFVMVFAISIVVRIGEVVIKLLNKINTKCKVDSFLDRAIRKR